MAPCNEYMHIFFIALCKNFHNIIGVVAHPSGDIQFKRFLFSALPEINTLYFSFYGEMACFHINFIHKIFGEHKDTKASQRHKEINFICWHY